MKRVVLMIAAACIFTGAFTQRYTLSGIVKDSNGDPLTGANVVINKTFLGVATDLKGEFSFQLSKGEYSISVSFLGYEKYQKDILLDKDDYLDVVLKSARR